MVLTAWLLSARRLVADAGADLVALTTIPDAATGVPARSLAAVARTDILWIGGAVPKPLTAALMVRYDIVPVDAAAGLIDEAAPTARAVLVEVAPEMADLVWAEGVVEVALDHGLLVIFTTPDLADDECELARQHCYTITQPFVKGGRIRACFNDWAKIASVLGEHDPKGGCNRALRITSEASLQASAETLIRRAFYDFNGLTLELVQGGKSGAAVWIARPSDVDRGRRAAPFLVKWNTLDKMRQEQSNVMQYASNTVSFRLTPPLHPSRCIEGNTTALLVFDFIDRAVSFASAIQIYPAGQLIGSLFDHTLVGCLAVAKDITSDITAAYERNGLLRWTEELRTVAVNAALFDGSVMSSAALAARLRSLGLVTHRVATMHGDMHVLNLLVATGSSDVLLIDFGKIMPNTPIVADAASLEVSLTFPTEEGRIQLQRSSPSIDQDWLERAYVYPLDPHRVPARDDRERWLPDAVRAIRAAARQHEPSAASYAMAIIVYLLRYASFEDNGSLKDRALAYRLACRLATAVARDLGENKPVTGNDADAA